MFLNSDNGYAVIFTKVKKAVTKLFYWQFLKLLVTILQSVLISCSNLIVFDISESSQPKR